MSERLSLRAEQGEGSEKVVFELYESTDRNLEIFTEGIHGISIVGPIAKINFFTRGAAIPSQPERRDLACRLVMGVDTFLAIADQLKAAADELRPKIQIQTFVPQPPSHG
jgi:hypothetical protein